MPRKSEYGANFENAKNSKYSEGESKTTGASSAEPDSYSKDYFDGKYKSNVSGADSENARVKRMSGRSQTQTGPKPRDYSFLKHTESSSPLKGGKK